MCIQILFKLMKVMLQVCDQKVGFYITEAIRNAISSLPCETVFIEAETTDALALVLIKDSPYTGIVNY